MAPKVAAVTMAYDEAVLLPIWARHYARQVGADHCYVVDHGSRTLPPLPPGVNTLRLPRSPHDDARRAGFISSFVASLLGYYDWVVHTDVDELVMADPLVAPNLAAYCQDAQPPTITAVGLELQHRPDVEPPLDPARPLGPQRRWVRFTSAMCKPVLTRRAVSWAPGFHTATGAAGVPEFDQLYLFHLHWVDRDIGLDRLAKTRTMPWSGPQHGAHQRIANAEWQTLFDGMARLPAQEDVAIDTLCKPLSAWLDRVRESASTGLDLHLNAPELWPIPDRFRTRL